MLSLPADRQARMVLFWDGRCRHSQQLTPAVRKYCSAANRALDLVIVDVTSDGEGWQATVDNGDLRGCLVVPDRGREIASSYRAWGTPVGLVVDKDNVVVSPLLAGGAMIGSVLGTSSGQT
jgi:Thioredoxin-like